MNANQFKEQFLPYHAKLYRVAFRLMGNTQDAEDMVQEAYLRLWGKRNKLPEEIQNMEAYCITLVKNICYDALRLSHLSEDEHSPEELNLPESTDFAIEMEHKDEANQIMKLISQLPDQQQQIIRMRDIDDKSYDEIEKVTGLSAINIRVLLSRARKKIREQFKEIMNYERI